MGASIVQRDKFMAFVTKHGVKDSVVHTVNRTVMQYFNREGNMIASAEYIRVEDWPCKVTYRIVKQEKSE